MNPALVVDLDGTLLRTDLLWECFWNAMRIRPWIIALLPIWLIQGGKLRLKEKLAGAARLDFKTLPY